MTMELASTLAMLSSLKQLTEGSDYGVKVNLAINNFTKYELTDPITISHHGQIPRPATLVGAGKRELMVMHKTPYSLRGTEGTVSWKISPTKRIIVMWSAPDGFTFYNNELAVGIIGVHSHDNSTNWFKRMYSNDGSGPFTRAKFGDNGYSRPLNYSDRDGDGDGEFGVLAFMGTSHQPDVTISVYPLKEENLAEKLEKSRPTQEFLAEKLEKSRPTQEFLDEIFK